MERQRFHFRVSLCSVNACFLYLLPCLVSYLALLLSVRVALPFLLDFASRLSCVNAWFLALVLLFVSFLTCLLAFFCLSNALLALPRLLASLLISLTRSPPLFLLVLLLSLLSLLARLCVFPSSALLVGVFASLAYFLCSVYKFCTERLEMEHFATSLTLRSEPRT